MGFGNFFKKVGNSITSTVNTVWNGTQKATVCMTAINNVRGNVQGHDPRTWMTSCAQSTIFKMQGPEYFKQCLENKIKTEIKDIKDPKKYVDSLWDEIKGGCS